jgi:pimeloyl-ACP methyl ester carboxylesterase
MKRLATLAFVSIAAFVAMLGAALCIINDATAGKPAFYIWKLFSGKAHGGKYVNINNVRIYYETYGAGPPVLVLHGGLGSIEDMRYQIRALAANHLVVAVDSRGHGRSTDSDAPLSYVLMADDMLKLLDEMSIDRVNLVGWSDGGIIGLDLAMHHPDRIRRLVVIGANYQVDGLRYKPILGPKIPPPPWNKPDWAHWPEFYRKVIVMWQTQPHYTLEELRMIKAPTLVMTGEFDAIEPWHSKLLAKNIAAGREDIIKGGAHSVLYREPEIVNSHMLSFFNE